MRLRFQLASCLILLGLSTALAVPCPAQRAKPNGAPQRDRPPKAQERKQAPPRNQQERRPQNQAPNRQNSGGNAARNGANRPDSVTRPNGNPNRPPSAYTPPPAPPRKFSDLSPQDRQKVLEYNRKYQNLTPAQRQELKDRQKAWDGLTPAQQGHIRNDVLPKWREMPQDRRQAIRQRLRVLQNMPESARNQRLNDPNFTKGMSEEDKVTLRDLSHMHVGAPDPPGE